MGSQSKGRTVRDKYTRSLGVIPLTHQYVVIFSEVHSNPATSLFLRSLNSDHFSSLQLILHNEENLVYHLIII